MRMKSESAYEDNFSKISPLGRLLASPCRQKILQVLSKVGQTRVTDLVRMVNSTYNKVNRNLHILERQGIIKNKYYGRIRMIRLNRDNSKTEAILKALRILRRAELQDIYKSAINKQSKH